MSDSRAIKVLSETPTDFGYVIREEVWESPKFEVAPVSGVNDDDDLASALQNQIDAAPDEMVMTTCYTDDGYWIGNPETAKFLCEERGIAPEPDEPIEPGVLRPCRIGFSAKDGKWYGWSNRAIFGFEVGSVVQMGDCGFVPRDEIEAAQAAVLFWSDQSHKKTKARWIKDDDGLACIKVTWTYSNDPKIVPNEKLRGQEGGTLSYPPKEWGHGAWTAETLDDARQMAIDFAEGVG